MRLKNKITKAEFDALPAHFQECYVASGDDYVLDSEEAANLKKARDDEAEARRREKERADRLQAEKDEAERKQREAEEEAARKKGDVAALEASWQQKLEAAKAEAEAKTAALLEKLKKLLVDNKALEIANKISTAPGLILPHIRARLQADVDGDAAVTRVLDADGKVSAKNVDELEKEFIDNKEFSAIIKGSNASGGGSNTGGSGGSGGSGDKKISDMNDAERVDLYNRLGSVEYKRRVEAEKAA